MNNTFSYTMKAPCVFSVWPIWTFINSAKHRHLEFLLLIPMEKNHFLPSSCISQQWRHVQTTRGAVMTSCANDTRRCDDANDTRHSDDVMCKWHAAQWWRHVQTTRGAVMTSCANDTRPSDDVMCKRHAAQWWRHVQTTRGAVMTSCANDTRPSDDIMCKRHAAQWWRHVQTTRGPVMTSCANDTRRSDDVMCKRQAAHWWRHVQTTRGTVMTSCANDTRHSDDVMCKRHAAQWWGLREVSLQKVSRQRGTSPGYPLCQWIGNLLATWGSITCWLQTRLYINRPNLQHNRPMPINEKNSKNRPIDQRRKQ